MRSVHLQAVLLLACVLTLSGCFGRKARDAQAQATANAAAGIFEAAVAIEQGTPPAAPLTAIKASAAAIIKVQDRTYAPSDTWAAAPATEQVAP